LSWRSRSLRRLPAGLALLVLLWPHAALAQQALLVSGEELLINSAAYDGTRVMVEGELVGDYGFRDDGFMWTQLNDDSYARRALVDGGPRTGGNIGIGIRMPAALADGLDPVGGYRLEGPLVLAEGTWRHHDPERGGESYLDVAVLTIVEPGRRLQEGPDWEIFIVGSLLSALVLGMWWRRRGVEAESD
jgi:hypothetical protein